KELELSCRFIDPCWCALEWRLVKGIRVPAPCLLDRRIKHCRYGFFWQKISLHRPSTQLWIVLPRIRLFPQRKHQALTALSRQPSCRIQLRVYSHEGTSPTLKA